VYPGGERCPICGIRRNDWLLIWNPKPDLWPAGRIEPEYNWCDCPFGDVDAGPSKSRILLLAEAGDSAYYWLAFMKRPEYELYDVTKDPYQMNNLSDNPHYQDVLGDLKRELMQYLQKTYDPRIEVRDSVFVNTPYFGLINQKSMTRSTKSLK
jgi:hypothetical protein